MDDDLNTPKALGALFVFIREFNAVLDSGVADKFKKDARKALENMVTDTLGIAIERVAPVAVDHDLQKLLSDREAARLAKDFTKADAIRKTLNDRGYAIIDGADGAKLKKL